VGHYHHSKTRPQFVDGVKDSNTEGSCDILNRLSRTAEKKWSSSLGVGRAAKNCST